MIEVTIKNFGKKRNRCKGERAGRGGGGDLTYRGVRQATSSKVIRASPVAWMMSAFAITLL